MDELGNLTSAIERWVELLDSEDAAARLRAATELGRLGVLSRGAVRTRGSIRRVAGRRPGVGQETTRRAYQALQADESEVRSEIAFALGDWLAEGDDVGIETLAQCAREDPDPFTRASAADALGRIGGPIAVKALVDIVKLDLDTHVRVRSLRALRDLLAAESSDEGLPETAISILREVASEREPSRYLRQLAEEMLQWHNRTPT